MLNGCFARGFVRGIARAPARAFSLDCIQICAKTGFGLRAGAAWIRIVLSSASKGTIACHASLFCRRREAFRGIAAAFTAKLGMLLHRPGSGFGVWQLSVMGAVFAIFLVVLGFHAGLLHFSRVSVSC
jgi:hypothetical protein